MYDIDHVDMVKFWLSLAFLLSYFKNPRDGERVRLEKKQTLPVLQVTKGERLKVRFVPK